MSGPGASELAVHGGFLGWPWWPPSEVAARWVELATGQLAMRMPPKRAFSTEEVWTRLCLQVAVPMWLQRWRDEGLTLEQVREVAQAEGDVIAERSDLIMRKADGSALAFNAIAKGVAALSLQPGGVTLFEAHFETPPSFLEKSP